MDAIGDFAHNYPTLFLILLAYVGLSGLVGLTVVRPPLARWWNSQFILVSGPGLADVLLRQLGYRLAFELCVFAIACIYGSLGGWIYVLSRQRNT
jgi:hypothetical protein